MRIKRLEICGFKSFVERTVLTFDDPITGVVGPNGCGKSNIVDAIRWVMGEQSAKHLRGRAMEDVVFNGSESRGPAGMAEVSITFDAGSLAGGVAPGGVPWGAAGPSDVVVTRRYYRGGESEYLLGGVPCRLRDIVEFFLGTGVGSKAYAVIEQGRIGFIVSSRSEDRRALIDEAAGITKYKAKKKIAERRMEATHQHLLRVTDILGEIETQLRSLKLQAQKAERYKRYKAELRDLELWAATHRYLGMVAEEKFLAAAHAELEARHAQGTAALAAEEASVEAERLSLVQEQDELSRTKDELFALDNRAQLSAQLAEHRQDESATLVGRAERSRKDSEDHALRIARAAESLREIEGQVASLDADAENRDRALAALETTFAAARDELAAVRQACESTVAATNVSRTRVARLESDIESARVRALDLAQRLEDLRRDDRVASETLERVYGEARQTDTRGGELQARAGELAESLSRIESRVAALRAEVARGEIELETLREEAHRRRSRLQSLTEIQARYESFQRGVRAIMQRVREPLASSDAAGGSPAWTAGGVRGLVADIVQPPPELETALEAVLGERLGNIIVESHEVGVEAIDYLKQRSEGRSSFIPLSLRTPSPPGTVLYDATGGASLECGTSSAVVPVEWPSGEGVRGPMLELIGFDRDYDRVAAYLLGDVMVVENLPRALEIWRQTRTSKTLVTLDGEVIDPHGVVTGGSREAATASVLSQKREIRELEEVVAQLERDYQASLARHVGNKQALADAIAEFDATSSAIRRDEVDLAAQKKDAERLAREREMAESRRAQIRAAIESVHTSIEENQARWQEASAQLAAEQERVEQGEAGAGDLRSRVSVLSERSEAILGDLSAARIEAAQAGERKRTAHQSVERLRREVAEYEGKRAQLAEEMEADLVQAGRLRVEAEQLRQEAARLQDDLAERTRAFGQRQGAAEERSGQLARREADLKTLRSQVGHLAQELSSLDLRCQETAMRLRALDEQVCERYADVGKVAEVVADFHLRGFCGESQEGRIRELRGLLERMTEVNLMAIEQSAELQQRYEFLSAQKADLESATNRLETAINKINHASRRRFREVFDAVNAKFQQVFPHLFGGGKAYLALTDEGDLLETGVEIVANPPGKKMMQNLELLSGGEKALTAVSLLFAIFLVKPSPFCVLDEVDAPLDDANVGRFNHAVREMTDQAQFIIVTHNQRTMEIADRLCGITMEESGVSKLVAVKLRDRDKPPPPDFPRATAAPGAAPAA
ncbi:MAG: chromosome segregation protein SMC [Deltaproteobacteria bacterium]|nr:chromosome segregation protein SMC [Deltaproteobacteria bacterium]